MLRSFQLMQNFSIYAVKLKSLQFFPPLVDQYRFLMCNHLKTNITILRKVVGLVIQRHIVFQPGASCCSTWLAKMGCICDSGVRVIHIESA